MLGVTLFGIFLTPVFFYVIRRFVGKSGKPVAAGDSSGDHEETLVPAAVAKV